MIAISLKDTVDIEWREAVEVLRLSYNLTLQNSSSEQNFAVLGINVPYTIFYWYRIVLKLITTRTQSSFEMR